VTHTLGAPVTHTLDASATQHTQHQSAPSGSVSPPGLLHAGECWAMQMRGRQQLEFEFGPGDKSGAKSTPAALQDLSRWHPTSMSRGGAQSCCKCHCHRPRQGKATVIQPGSPKNLTADVPFTLPTIRKWNLGLSDLMECNIHKASFCISGPQNNVGV
jgi:hypothetical protein